MSMKLSLILILSVFSVSVIFSNTVQAELDATFWAPEEILLKEEYSALIIINSDTDTDSKFDIVTDNEEVIKIKTKTVVIPAGQHHGLVEFETIGTGGAEIYAIFQDTLLQENIRVVESAESPTKLDLILPSNLVNVLVDDNQHIGYVFLLNDFENPVVAKSPITVSLTSNGEITLPSKSVTVEGGQHYAKFVFEAQGEGTISVTASNLLPDEDDISLEDTAKIELKMAVAPEPIPTDSSGEIYFWLERDGKPYVASHDVKITLSIGESTNLSFDSAVKGTIILSPNTSDDGTPSEDGNIVTRTAAQLAYDSKREFILESGNHYGKMQAYSTLEPLGGITISGLAESMMVKDDEEIIRDSESIDISTEESNFNIGTETRVFAFPDPAYKQVEIIVSSYSGEGPVIERDDESFNLFTNSKLMVEPVAQKIIKSDENYAIVKADVIDSGTVDIFAERNEAESEEISIITSGKYVKDPELGLVTLPVIFDTEQDLFLISSSQEKIMTDVFDDDDGNLISITSRPDFDYEVIQESESVITVRGQISKLLEDDPEIHVASNAFTVQDVLDVYNPGRKKISALHPEYIYPDELFPIITHIGDLDENPIRKEVLKISSVEDMGASHELFYFNQTGTHDIIFFDTNSVPIKSTIDVKGASQARQQSLDEENRRIPTTTYEIEVIDGSGSGVYNEDEDVTISAPATKDDIFIIKKKFVGWEDLPYMESTVTFEADEDLSTKPIYEDDYTFLLLITGSAGGIGVLIAIRKKRKGSETGKKSTSEDDDLMDLLKD